MRRGYDRMLKCVAHGIIYCCLGQIVFTLVVYNSICYCLNKLHLPLSQSLIDLIEDSIYKCQGQFLVTDGLDDSFSTTVGSLYSHLLSRRNSIFCHQGQITSMVTTVVTGTFYLLLPWRQAIYLFIYFRDRTTRQKKNVTAQ